MVDKIEEFYVRFRKNPKKSVILTIVSFLLLLIIWFLSAYISEKGKQFASSSTQSIPKSKPDTTLFEDGWVTYHRFQLNKKNPKPIEVGSCPGTECYRFTLGPRETRNGVHVQTINLSGGGFEKNIEKMPNGGIRAFRVSRLYSKGGSYGIPVKQGYITANLGLFRGASLRLRAIDNDILFIVEDDRINHLTVGIAMYEGTYCNLYKEGKLAPNRNILECEE